MQNRAKYYPTWCKFKKLHAKAYKPLQNHVKERASPYKIMQNYAKHAKSVQTHTEMMPNTLQNNAKAIANLCQK